MKSKLLISILILFILSGITSYFLFFHNYITVAKINTDIQHKISTEELAQTKQLFEKNKLDISNLQFTWFRSEDENQPQAIYEIHISAEQFYNGLLIFSGRVTYHFNKSTGLLDSISGKRITNLSISTKPQISLNKAAKNSGVVSPFLNGELGIYSFDPTPGDLNSDSEYVLSWKITPRGSKYPVAFIDATTGKVLLYFDGIFT